MKQGQTPGKWDGGDLPVTINDPAPVGADRPGKHVIVAGGGAAGMAAAYAAAKNGHRVTLIEQNEKLGKKVYITGKGRCNLTNDCSVEDMLNHVVRNPKFLYSALYAFTGDDVRDLLASHGCPTVTERGNRVFPVSGHSSDVIKAWNNALRENGVKILLNTRVTGIGIRDGRAENVQTDRGTFPCDAVILASGGLSYPSTGSTGDGFLFAKACGHTVTACYPSLVPFETAENWVRPLSGLTLKNISIEIRDGERKLYSEFGDLLFTHTGVSGPVILSASSYLTERLHQGSKAELRIDLKPALSCETLDLRILRDFELFKNRKLQNALQKLMPSSLVPVVIAQAGADPDIPVTEVRKEMRQALLQAVKGLKLTVTGTGGYREAIITKGGVSVREIDPSTMESRRVKGLYFAGEMIDTDALTGGFNLQIAWSTGYLAGSSI